ncbi:MAG: hypothetical protein Q8910_00715 [Bacteroidota bacterium]|nr:hypothetical protein [Bacteroidota bacterium]
MIVAIAPFGVKKAVVKWGDRYTILGQGMGGISQANWKKEGLLTSTVFKGDYVELEEPIQYEGSDYDIKQ